MNNIIISLTSYPDRINTISFVIKSLLEQTLQPEKIILWLANEQFPNKENDLPKNLLNLKSDIFEIDWCEDIRSYKKLIPTLKKYPDKTIVTCDDDIIYEKKRLELLYKASIKYPDDVLCHRAHYTLLDKNKNVKPYKEWLMECFGEICSYNVFPTTGGMVLYPPNCFYKDVLDSEKFMTLCKDTDDIWFWAMCVLNNKKPRLIKKNINKINMVEREQKSCLYKNNIKYLNDNNLKNLFNTYPDLYKKLSNRKPYRFLLDKLFSARTNKTHKIITIFGFKIKLKKRNNNIFVINQDGSKKHTSHIKGLKIFFNGSNSTVNIHKPIPKFIDCEIHLKNNCLVSIGHSKYRFNKLKILSSRDNCSAIIGDNCSAQEKLELLLNSENNKQITIGNNCMFGSNVMIRTGDVHSITDSTGRIINMGNDVNIGNNVWICYGVTILKGTSIADGIVIGTQSIVTKSCDKPYSLYAGIPAKCRKSDVHWNRTGPDELSIAMHNKT